MKKLLSVPQIMKRRLALTVVIFMLSLALSACNTTALSKDTIVFPGTNWDMTASEVMDALEIKENGYTVVSESDSEYIITVQDLTLYSRKADVTFVFKDFTSTRPGLYLVFACFNSPIEMPAIQKSIERDLGAPAYTVQESNRNIASWASLEKCTDLFLEAYSKQSNEFSDKLSDNYDNALESAESTATSSLSLYEKPSMSEDAKNFFSPNSDYPMLLFWGNSTPYLQYCR